MYALSELSFCSNNNEKINKVDLQIEVLFKIKVKISFSSKDLVEWKLQKKFQKKTLTKTQDV